MICIQCPLLTPGVSYQHETSHLYIQIHVSWLVSTSNRQHLPSRRPHRADHCFPSALIAGPLCFLAAWGDDCVDYIQSEDQRISEMWINGEKNNQRGTGMEGWILLEGETEKVVPVVGVWESGSLGVLARCCGFAYIVLRDNSVAECACACSYEPLYWNAGLGHSAAHSFNFCKQTNSRRLEDHTAFLLTHSLQPGVALCCCCCCCSFFSLSHLFFCQTR